MTETLLIKSDIERFADWTEAFADCDLRIADWNDGVDPEEVDYALVWKPEPGALARLPNLKVIFSLGAGLDHLKGENILPPDTPVVRMVEEGLTAGMVEYVLYMVLHFHRFMPQYRRDQASRTWRPLIQIGAGQRTVGLLGLGVMGRACGEALKSLGFNVSGWSRSPKNLDGITCFHGEQQLPQMLGHSNILVCLLPLTPQTRHIINAQNIAHMPRGSYVINAGRGGHLNQQDVLDALDSGHLAGTALDVFETEPLPEDHPFWQHPGVIVTPHIASMTLPGFSARHVYENIVNYRNQQPLTHVADMQRGY